MADDVLQAFDTYTIMEAIPIIKPPKLWLLSLFFKGKKQADTQFLQFEIYRGGMKLAPFVRSEAQGQFVENRGYEVYTYEAPYSKTLRRITAKDLKKKKFGSGVYEPTTASYLEDQLMGLYLQEEKDAIWRLQEWMASKILLEGKITVNGKGYNNVEIDFRQKATHQKAVGDLVAAWDQTTADPIKDIQDWAYLIEQDSGHISDTLILGTDAGKAFIDNAKVRQLLDNRRVEAGKIKPTDVVIRDDRQAAMDRYQVDRFPKKVKYLGTISTLAVGEIDIFVYNETYKDEAGTIHQMVGSNKAILGSTDALGAKNFGAIEDLDYGDASGFVQEEIFIKSRRIWDPSAVEMLIQSAPLPMIYEIDAFVNAEVLT